MGKIVGICLLTLCLVGITAHLVVALDSFPVRKFPTFKTNKPVLKPLNTPTTKLKSLGNTLNQCSIPDPALTNVHVGHVSTSGERSGFYEVLILGEVINAGRGVYPLETKPIWVSLNSSGRRVRGVFDKSISVGELGPGDRSSFSLRLNNVSSGADFIPEYVVSMNPSGPDCRQQNNRIIISAAEISRAIAAGMRTKVQITRVRTCVRPGRSVVVDGLNFGSDASRYTIMFGKHLGEILSWTDRQLIIKVPSGLDPDMAVPLTLHSARGRSPALTSFPARTCSLSSRLSRTVSATPVDFKFGTMTSPADQSIARGVRPLLVILAPNGSRSIRPTLQHDAAYYNQKVFGPGYPNVVDYYKVNSYFAPYTARGGHGFTWSKAAIVGPIVTHFRPSSTTEQRLPSLKIEAAKNGFDFSRYDRNRDGRVTASELGILLVDNFTTGGGRTINTESCTNVPVPGRRKRISVCTGGSFVGHDASLATFAHELSHLLGTIDIYGSSCLSKGLSLMSCTGYEGPLLKYKANETFLLDPWHRSRLGWLKPRIYSITTAGSALLREPTELYGESYNAGPIILYDPRKGFQEYFILEYRAQQRSKKVRGYTSDDAYGYDADVPEDGVAVWHVRTTPAGNLIKIPDRIGGTVYSAVVISPPRHGLGAGWGGRALWSPRDGDFRLKWLNRQKNADGQDVGIRLKVYDEGNGYAKIRWDPRR